MRSELLAALLLAASAAGGRAQAAKLIPDAETALAGVASLPSAGAVAHGRIQFFRVGRKPQGFGTTVYALPDGRLRREIREKGPRGPAAAVILDDGKNQNLYLTAIGCLWSGAVPRESGAESFARLKSIYSMTVSAGGHVARHSTWRVDFRAPGGPLRRSFWVDRETGLLLKTEVYRYDGTLARRERLVKLETPAQVDPALFVATSFKSASVRPLIPTDPPVAGTKTRFPHWMPIGFLPLDARADVRGARISYSDGAARYELFEGPAGSNSGLDEKTGREVRLKDGSTARLLPAGDGAALVRRADSETLVIAGDLADEELVRVAESLEAPR